MNDSDVLGLSIQIASSFYEKRAEFARGLDARAWLDLIVAFVGLACAAICVCRMGRLTGQHRLLPRLSCVSLFTGSLCLVFAPWLFGSTYVRTGALLFTLAVIAHLMVLGLEWWQGKPPESMETKPGDLL